MSARLRLRLRGVSRVTSPPLSQHTATKTRNISAGVMADDCIHQPTSSLKKTRFRIYCCLVLIVSRGEVYVSSPPEPERDASEIHDCDGIFSHSLPWDGECRLVHPETQNTVRPQLRNEGLRVMRTCYSLKAGLCSSHEHSVNDEKRKAANNIPRYCTLTLCNTRSVQKQENHIAWDVNVGAILAEKNSLRPLIFLCGRRHGNAIRILGYKASPLGHIPRGDSPRTPRRRGREGGLRCTAPRPLQDDSPDEPHP